MVKYPSVFRLRSGDRVLTLHPGAWAVGRLPTAGIFVNDSEVSRQHAIVHVDEGGVELEDLKSRNGSFVNGVQVVGRFQLRPGDRLRFGLVEFVLESDDTPTEPKRDFTPISKVPGTYPGSRPPSVTEPPPPGPGGPTQTLEIPRSAVQGLAAEAPAPRAQIILCLADQEWAERLRRAISVEPSFAAKLVGAREVEAAASAAAPGCLLLDMDLVGKATQKIIEAWWGKERRRGPVLLVSLKPEHEGVVLARNLGAQAYVRAGKGADMVVAQMRYQIQRAGAGRAG